MIETPISRRSAFVGAASGILLAGCSPAGILNAISGFGSESARAVGKDIAFGDDPQLELDIWAPQAASTSLLPVVIFLYGGGWNSGDRGDYAFVGRALAEQGFVCVIPDYRLVPDVLFPAFIADGAKAVRWVMDNIGQFGGDPKRIALAGHSAGSYNAAMLALDSQFLRDAGVPPGTIRAAALMSGPYDFYPFTESLSRDALGQWPRPLETQPITFANRDAPPMLLMHGTSDSLVRAHNSERLAAALRARGAIAELKLYPGKSHTDTIKSISPVFRSTTPALSDMIDFLRRYDGPEKARA